MKNKKAIAGKLSLLGVCILMLIACLNQIGFYNYKYFNKEIKLNFSDQILNNFAIEQESIGNNQEFVGYLYLNNTTVESYGIIGYKQIPTGKVTLRHGYDKLDLSYASIHSHPDNFWWSCLPSTLDKGSFEDIICIYCKDEVKCYER